MTSRRATPNLLDPMSDVMGTSKQESNRTVKRDDNKKTEQKKHKEIKPERIESDFLDEGRVEGLKEKATFNLSKDLLNDLDETWIGLRRNLRGQRITKTMIVEEAIMHAIEDLEKNKSASWLYRRIESNKESRQ